MGLRVGFLIDRWDPERGGAERALAALAGHLAERGHDVRAFALDGRAGAPGRLHVVKVPRWSLRSRRERALGGALVEAAETAGCEVTVAVRHVPRADVYWPHGGAHLPSFQARRRARGREPETPRGRHATFLDLERALLDEGGARRVVCVSDLVRDELTALHPACAERTVVVPNGVDLEAFHPRNRADAPVTRAAVGVPPAAALVLFVGRDPWLKGLPALLSALTLLPAGLDWRLVVAGPRRPGAWLRRAARFGVAARVAVSGDVSVRDLLAAADVLALPTWRDPAPLVVLEALASGTPVVTTRCAGSAGLVDHPDAGTVLADPGDAVALGEALAAWLVRSADGGVDRAAVRARVLGCGHGPWLERLTGLVLSERAA